MNTPEHQAAMFDGAMTVTTPTRRGTVAGEPNRGRFTRSRVLLVCGAVAGPLFLTAVLVQAAARDGFDPSRHPLSALSLGDLGWIQITNFVVTGLCATGGAVGARRTLRTGPARVWGPRLIGLYGLGLIAAAIFVTDPVSDFPTAGTGAATPSWQGRAHDMVALVSGLALDAAIVAFVRRFIRRGQHAWASYSIAAVAVDLVAAGSAAATGDFRWLLLGGTVTWTWASALSLELLRQYSAATRP
ncbi:DUF998 domain-containing protein [Nonomuraea sp. NPDC048916]|uniref:DUF998 domain-containing protein n=1 Tax=Nonomuraea sp. NPDC048916 TaxID=3154232 RepID=UPI0033E0AB27